MLTAAAALLVAGTLLWLGRRDLTRPAVAFGVPWFAFVALAQLRLTELEGDWSTPFTLTVLGGGLAFVVAALIAGGTAPARGKVPVDRDSLAAGRLTIAAAVLLAAGAAGVAYKADRLGGVPLLSDNPDLVRGRAFRTADLPAWSSMLTGGLYLSLWCSLAAAWVLWGRASRLRIAGLLVLAAVALFGVSLEASRNVILFALAVPAIGAYVITKPRPGRSQLAWTAAAVAILVAAVGGLLALRLTRGEPGARAYVEQESERQPAVLRPVVPAYITGVFPLEAERRLYEGVPGRYSYAHGGASLNSLPAAAFPAGKPTYGDEVADLMTTTERAQITWSVANYQGRLLKDAGWSAVLLGSLLLGIAAGSLYRWARARAGPVAVAVVAYTAYYCAFMAYDNPLSFSLIGIFDVAVIAAVALLVRRRSVRAAGEPAPA